MALLVAKADGSMEEFSEAKLLSSLRRAGAAEDAAQGIAQEVHKELYNGISTNEIYRRAFAHLRDHRHAAAARYSLKRAVLEFGPSGFPFEEYLADLYRAEGYTAKTDQIIKGACVEHEVDVVATKDGITTYVEAKFHNTAGFKSDLKTSLYVKARMDDIREAVGAEGMRGLLVTNTKFTDKALQYSQCRGLDLLGWDYPEKGNLHDRIEAAKLYPVTALTMLSRREKTALLNEKVVLCNDLPREGNALERAGIKGKRADSILEEVGALCVPGKAI